MTQRITVRGGDVVSADGHVGLPLTALPIYLPAAIDPILGVEGPLPQSPCMGGLPTSAQGAQLSPPVTTMCLNSIVAQHGMTAARVSSCLRPTTCRSLEPEIWTVGKRFVVALVIATSPLRRPGAEAVRHTAGCLVRNPAAARSGCAPSSPTLGAARAVAGHRWVLAVIALLEDRWPADEIADRARRQSELGEESDGGAGRDHVGEVLLGVGGDQYHW